LLKNVRSSIDSPMMVGWRIHIPTLFDPSLQNDQIGADRTVRNDCFISLDCRFHIT
jgi:hypothetical protein